MSDLLQTIQNTVAKELKSPFVEYWGDLHSTKQVDLWPEVCKRYAFEVAKASLKEASENAVCSYERDMLTGNVDKESITDESNIKL